MQSHYAIFFKYTKPLSDQKPHLCCHMSDMSNKPKKKENEDFNLEHFDI